MYRESLSNRDAENRELHEQISQSNKQITELQIDNAKLRQENAMLRERDEERAAIYNKLQEEKIKLTSELNSVSASLQHTSQSYTLYEQKYEALENSYNGVQANSARLEQTIHRLVQDLKIVNKELLQEREVIKYLRQFKIEVREYANSLSNLNYELSTDIDMAQRKRLDLLKHAQELLQGLKKLAWNCEQEIVLDNIHTTHQHASSLFNASTSTIPSLAASASEAIHAGPDVQQVLSAAAIAVQHAREARTGTAPESKENDGHAAGSSLGSSFQVYDEQQKQKYLLASASSPEAIRVVHHHESDDEGEECKRNSCGCVCASKSGKHTQACKTARTSLYIPNEPTISSAHKVARRSAGRVVGGKQLDFTTVQHDNVVLPYTIGKSANASFSVPVNVQEILAKQPVYYSKIHSSSTRSAASAYQNTRVVYVQVPVAATDDDAASISSHDSNASIPLIVHTQGLKIVIQNIEAELNKLNKYDSMS